MKLVHLKSNINSDMVVYNELRSIVSLTLDHKVSMEMSFPITLFDLRRNFYEIVHEKKKPDMR
ncbi:hypothetical protein UFOVP787_63 [uncultured Caudovirales phage]|uniref:Uncharacterized protein n=1 Tax=uncultured Caudovirales phage TaxID=2100421 RepID=A0A6J5NUU3_9CAUD|nr:hypothetical protein UFOVP787_63 [uncultured Caudovirales phage]